MCQDFFLLFLISKLGWERFIILGFANTCEQGFCGENICNYAEIKKIKPQGPQLQRVNEIFKKTLRKSHWGG